MKVLLANPPSPDTFHILPPIGLLAVSAALRAAGHTTQVYDMLALRATADDLKRRIAEFDPDIVGVGYTTPQSYHATEVARAVHDMGRKVIIGGPHPTALPQRSLEETRADAAFLWEVEHTIANGVKAVADGTLSAQTPGVAYLEGDRLVTGPSAKPVVHLDELPRLDYGEIPFRIYAMRQFSVRFPRRRPMTTIITSRGCPHRCSFCMNFNGRQWRYQSAGRVLEDIGILVERFGVQEIWIFDDNFTNKKSRVLEICDGIRSKGYRLAIRFPNGVRADRIDDEILRALKAAGTYSINIGVESANPAILERLGKGETIEQIREAIDRANRAGILTCGVFVFGLPGDTEATVRDSIQFALSSKLDDALFNVGTPYPGTRLWNENKQVHTLDWKAFDHDAFVPMSCTEHITPQRLVQLTRIAYRRFLFRPKILLKNLRYLLNPVALVILWNKILLYFGLRSGNL